MQLKTRGQALAMQAYPPVPLSSLFAPQDQSAASETLTSLAASLHLEHPSLLVQHLLSTYQQLSSSCATPSHISPLSSTSTSALHPLTSKLIAEIFHKFNRAKSTQPEGAADPPRGRRQARDEERVHKDVAEVEAQAGIPEEDESSSNLKASAAAKSLAAESSGVQVREDDNLTDSATILSISSSLERADIATGRDADQVNPETSLNESKRATESEDGEASATAGGRNADFSSGLDE